MDTILIITILVAAGAGIAIYLMKRGKIKDTDGDLIPDVVEDVVEDVVTVVKGKSKKVTKSSLRSKTKAQLIDLANKEFNVEFDSSLTKTNLINKVYELYNKK